MSRLNTRSISALALAVLLAGCSQINSLGVEPGENALACVKGSTSPFPGIGGSGIMIDAGKTDTSNYTPEDWKSLAEICD
jgi:hypothetical protein